MTTHRPSNTQARNVACLSLDGGGVRSLSQLLVLRDLMLSIDPEDPPKPCECFQMIGGSGTGGLLAILLGHLEMTVEECIDLLQSSQVAFGTRKNSYMRSLTQSMSLILGGRIYDTRVFDEELKKLLIARGFESDALFHDPHKRCKVFVTATRAETGDPVVFSNYDNPARSATGLEGTLQVVEVARATLAASSIFEPVKIGPYGDVFVDGSLGGNNPIRTLWAEALDLWKDESRLSCVVSMGSGLLAERSRSTNVFQNTINSLVAIANETEQTARSFAREHPVFLRDARYYRFNVQDGLQDIRIGSYEKLREIGAATAVYLQDPVVHENVRRCGRILAGLHLPDNEEPEQHPVPELTRQGSLEVDSHGLIVISPRDDDTTPEVDLIAVHGSTGGSYSTWRHQSGTNLLLDLLPQDFSSVRVMTYGHDLEVIRSADNDRSKTQASGRLFAIAETFLGDIDDNRKNESKGRPLIFLCHGIGGIIVKKALLIAHQRSSLFGSVLSSVIHIIFLDTPHRGYEARILETISDGSIVREFVLWSNVLRELNTEFGELAERMWFTSFFAGFSPTAVEGEISMVVEQASSILGFRKERSIMLENRSHSTIGHFSGPRDPNYVRLKARIENVILVRSPDLTFKVMEGCLRSVSFKTMRDEVFSTHGVLRNLVQSLRTVELGEEDVEELRSLARQCRNILVAMEDQLRRESNERSSVTTGGQEAPEIRYKLEELRNALKMRSTLLHRFYTNVMLRSASLTSQQRDMSYQQILARIEDKLDRLTEQLEEINKAPPREGDRNLPGGRQDSDHVSLPAFTSDSRNAAISPDG